MDKQRKLVLTPSAEKRLEAAAQEYREAVEELILRTRYVPGESATEVTAKDVELALRELHIVSRRQMDLRSLMVRTYLLIGVLMVIAGLFYPYFEQLFSSFRENPTRLMLVVTGASMAVLSWLFHRFLGRYRLFFGGKEGATEKKDFL